MTSSRLGIPREEFVNESEDPPIGSVIRAATSLTNMDARSQKIALICVIGVGLSSFILGFLCMFAISSSSLSMMAKLSRDSFIDDDFITEEIFERIHKETLGRNVAYFSNKTHPAGLSRDRDFATEIKNKFKEWKFDHVEIQSYEVLLSYPKELNKV